MPGIQPLKAILLVRDAGVTDCRERSQPYGHRAGSARAREGTPCLSECEALYCQEHVRTLKTLKPGQAGTKALLARYGKSLLCVRYRYDEVTRQRLKTVELIVQRRSR